MITSVASGILVNSGHLFENLVFAALRRIYTEVYYYRTKTGREVDFIVSTRNRPRILVQACESLAEPKTRTSASMSAGGKSKSYRPGGSSFPCRNRRTSRTTLLLLLLAFSEFARERTLASLDLPAPAFADIPAAPPSGGADDTRPPLRLAIEPIRSPERVMPGYRALARRLGDRLGRRGEAIFRSSYVEINDILRDRECEAAVLCSYSFVMNEMEFGAEALVAPVRGGETMLQSFILVPAGRSDSSLLDLEGTRIVLSDNLSYAGWIFPENWLRSRGKDPARFFRARVFSGSHDRSIALSRGQADAAAVSNHAYAEAPEEIRRKVTVVQRSPPVGMSPICVPKGLDSDLREGLRREFLSLHEDSEGREILRSLRIDRYVLPDLGSYVPVRTAYLARRAPR